MTPEPFPSHRFVRVSDLPALGLGTPEEPAQPLRFVHVVNTFPAKAGSEHERAQRLALASMREARRAAEILDPSISVRHVVAALPGEAPVTPDDAAMFHEVLTLPRSVRDLHAFRKPRPLPLLHDILMAPTAEPDDVLVYTNADITLTRDFHLFVAALFRRGLDAVVINRRTISDVWTEARDFDLMSAEAGAPHIGCDCFAFRAGLRERFVPHEACLGVGGVDVPLVHNLLAFAAAPVVLLDAHVTFHLGDDRSWTDPDLQDYAEHNLAQIDRVFDAIRADPARRDRLISAIEGSGFRGKLPNRLRERVGLPLLPPPPHKTRRAALGRFARRLLSLGRS